MNVNLQSDNWCNSWNHTTSVTLKSDNDKPPRWRSC